MALTAQPFQFGNFEFAAEKYEVHVNKCDYHQVGNCPNRAYSLIGNRLVIGICNRVRSRGTASWIECSSATGLLDCAQKTTRLVAWPTVFGLGWVRRQM